MNIQTTDAYGLYTKALFDAWRERIQPTSFLKSFFPEKIEPTLEVSIEVQRGFEKIAVDIVRGTEGNRNAFTRSTERIYIPPLYREFFDATHLQLYDRLYGATSIDDKIFAQYINNVVDAMMDCQDKIERSVELQCAQVLTTGVVSITADNDIDYKRKAASLVDLGGGNYWANNVDVFANLEAGCNFLRQVGKSSDGTFNLILGSTAMQHLLANTVFTARQNLFNMSLDAVVAPQRNAVGAALHGRITAGAYTILLWTYPQFYDNAAGTSTAYIDPKKVILLPQNPRFKTAYAAVPQLITPNSMPKTGKYIYNEYVDERKAARIIDIQSAPLAIPTAVDQMYTLKVVA